jgi:hypothetical protein
VQICDQQNVYLQVNSQAKNPTLKKYLKKHGPHSNLAVASIDQNTPAEHQPRAAKNMWERVVDQAIKPSSDKYVRVFRYPSYSFTNVQICDQQ